MGRSRWNALAFATALAAAIVVGTAAAVPAVRFTAPPTGLAIHGEDLWVSVAGDGTLHRFDARTGRRLARLEVRRANRLAAAGGTLAGGSKYVWVAAAVHTDDDPAIGDASGWIGRLDPARSTLRITQVHGDPPAKVAIGPAGVWISGGRTLRKVDRGTGRVVGEVRFGRYLGAVAVGADLVWVAAPNAGVLLRVDARTRKLVGSTSLGRATINSIALGRYLWAATSTGLCAVDRARGTVAFRVDLPSTSAVAVDRGRVWALAIDGLYSIEGRTPKRRLTLGPNTAGLLAASNGNVWLSDEKTNALHRAPG